MELSKQIEFLRIIDQSRSNHISYVNELADLLQISNDSAYRRLRGETSLTFDEISTLCDHYNVSFDAFNANEQTNVVSFQYQKMVGSAENFELYFSGLADSMKRINDMDDDNKKIIYAGQGVPIFHYFKYPALSAFKVFHWMTSGFQANENILPFDENNIDPKFLKDGQNLFKTYLNIPSIEIWSETIVMGTVHQIQFYWDSGLFKDGPTALKVCAEFRLLLEYIQEMCAQGKKQDDFTNPTIYGAPLELYYCEIELEKVCVLVNVGELKRVYMGQLTFGSMFTENREYYNETEQWLNAIIQKSNPISGVSQTMRYQFFKRSLKNLEKLEDRIREES